MSLFFTGRGAAGPSPPISFKRPRPSPLIKGSPSREAVIIIISSSKRRGKSGCLERNAGWIRQSEDNVFRFLRAEANHISKQALAPACGNRDKPVLWEFGHDRTRPPLPPPPRPPLCTHMHREGSESAALMWITAGNESGNDITAAHRPQPATFYPLTKRKKILPATPAVQGFSVSCDHTLKKIPSFNPRPQLSEGKKEAWLASQPQQHTYETAGR